MISPSTANHSNAVLRLGPFELLLDTNLLRKGDQNLNVGSRAISVLRCLAMRPGQTVSKQVLLQEAWVDEEGRKLVVETGSLQVQIHNLRKAMGRDAIKTVMDRGYQLNLPVSAPVQGPLRSLVPALVEPLVGRETDAQTLKELLSAHRLVTVLGAGGVGKTSLAMNVAGELDPTTTHWIPLAPLSVMDELVRSIASVARCEVSMLSASRVVESLAMAMRDFCGLIVIDNAEHLIDELREVIAAVLAQAPHARFLITSQVSLRIVGEEVFALSPLATPDPNLGDAALAETASVKLFTKIARINSYRDIDAAALQTIGRITRALHGNPLAIQLVASHAQTLGIDFLAGPVERMFELKTVHTSQPLRQRSLTDAFDWSLELLDEDSERMFHLIAQFPAGVNTAMLARVAASIGLELSRAIAIVGDLVDRSLVVRTNPSARLFIPEAGRYYSARRTLAEGTRTSLEHIFIDVMAQYARKTERMFWFAPAPFWRSDAMAEAENLRAAFSLAISREYTDPLAILAMAIRHVWSEDGRSPTPISLGEPRVAELISRALPEDLAIFRIFDALSGLGSSIWETILALEANQPNFGESQHKLVLGLAYAGECTASANYDLAHAQMCRSKANELLSSPELPAVVHHFALGAKGLVTQAAGELEEAQAVFDRRLLLTRELSPGFFGMALTDCLDCAWRRRDYVRLLTAWEEFPIEVARLRLAGQVGVLSILLLALSSQADTSRAVVAFRKLSQILKLASEFEPWVINCFARFALACGDPALAADIMAKGEHLEARSKRHRARIDRQTTAEILASIEQNFLRAARDRTLPLSLNEMLLRCAQHADRIEENVEEKLLHRRGFSGKNA